MQYKSHVTLYDRNFYAKRAEVQKLIGDVFTALHKMTNHIDENGEEIYTLKASVNNDNGVKPLTNQFRRNMEELGWDSEKSFWSKSVDGPGPVDFAMQLSDGTWFCVEWETGNKSSTNRAVEKLQLGMTDNIISGGILVVAEEEFQKHCTSGIGSFELCKHYIRKWRRHQDGDFFAIIGFTYDELIDFNHPEYDTFEFIPKGKDGHASRKQSVDNIKRANDDANTKLSLKRANPEALSCIQY